MTSTPDRQPTTAAQAPDQPRDFLREPCPEPGCSTVAIGSTEDDIRAVLYGHREEDHHE